jgi:hypothetical protein
MDIERIFGLRLHGNMCLLKLLLDRGLDAFAVKTIFGDIRREVFHHDLYCSEPLQAGLFEDIPSGVGTSAHAQRYNQT